MPKNPLRTNLTLRILHGQQHNLRFPFTSERLPDIVYVARVSLTIGIEVHVLTDILCYSAQTVWRDDEAVDVGAVFGEIADDLLGGGLHYVSCCCGFFELPVCDFVSRNVVM